MINHNTHLWPLVVAYTLTWTDSHRIATKQFQRQRHLLYKLKTETSKDNANV